MKYRTLGRAGVKVSEICLGTMSFGRWIDESESASILDRAIELGVNFIDTADMYGRAQDTDDLSQIGEAEEILGRLLKGRRDQVVLASKVYHPTGHGPNERGLSRVHIMQAVEDSLRRLQTDYLDLYITHRPDPETPIEETLSALDDLVRQGKVRYIGCSNIAAWQLCKALWVSDRRNLASFVSVQPEYSILRRDIERELLPFCQSEGVGVTVYSPLARGLLTGKYTLNAARDQLPENSRAALGERRIHQLINEESLRIVEALKPLAADRGQTLAQFALSWVLAQPAVTCALVGATNADRLSETVAAVKQPMEAETLRRVDEVEAETRSRSVKQRAALSA